MSVIKMTVAQYAEIRGIVSGAVRKAIKLGHAMPGVIKREKFGNAHVLHVDLSIYDKRFFVRRIYNKYLEVTK